MARLFAIATLSHTLFWLACGERLMPSPSEEAFPAWRRGRSRASALATTTGILMLAPGAVAQRVSVSEVDRNLDGVVDKEEFMLAVRDTINGSEDTTVHRKSVYSYSEGLFDASDIDGDGFLSTPELLHGGYISAAHAAAGWPALEARSVYDFGAAESEARLRSADWDQDERVSREEFHALCRKSLASWGWLVPLLDDPEFHDGLGGIFARADVDADGFLIAKELYFAWFLIIDFQAQSMTHAFLRTFDDDGDERVDRREFEQHIEKWRSAVGVQAKHKETFDWADDDGNGSLDVGELYAMSNRFVVEASMV